MGDCVFCQMIAKKIKAKIEYENDSLVAIQDIHPQAPVHLLIIPKQHISDVNALEKHHAVLLAQMIFCAKELASQKKTGEGYRLVLNNGAKAGQSVFHIHLHLLAGRQMNWPPG